MGWEQCNRSEIINFVKLFDKFNRFYTLKVFSCVRRCSLCVIETDHLSLEELQKG